MAEIPHEKIRAVAYELWERDGAPDGRDEEYWHAAVKLLSDEAGAQDAPDPLSALPIPPSTPSA